MKLDTTEFDILQGILTNRRFLFCMILQNKSNHFGNIPQSLRQRLLLIQTKKQLVYLKCFCVIQIGMFVIMPQRVLTSWDFDMKS